MAKKIEQAETQRGKLKSLAIEPYWAMEEASFAAMKASLEDGIQAGWLDEIEEEAKSYEVQNGVAVVRLSGPVTKRFSFWSWLFGGTSTQVTADSLRRAANDSQCTSIMLVIDSPGGSVSGVGDLADVVSAVNKRKPVCVYAEDMCASAAYWVASQAGKIYANSTAMVGSIGTYMVVHDYSKMVEGNGIKVHVIRAGEFKGAGTPGTEITDKQLAEFQRTTDQINAKFVEGVAAGRGMSIDAAAKLNDGRVHVGAEAVKMGLVDEICTLDEAIEKMRNMKQKSGAGTRQGGSMSTQVENETEVNASAPTKDAEAREGVAAAKDDIAALKAEIKALQEKNEQSSIALAAEKRARELEAATKEAGEAWASIPGLSADEKGQALLLLKQNGELGEKIAGALTAVNQHMKASATLAVVGSPVASGGASDIYGKVASAVAVARKENPALSEADATAFVFRTNRDLYEEYRAARN